MSAGYDAYRGSTLFEATLEVQTPLHIGAGFDRTMPRDKDETVDVAQLVMAANGLPAITPTALKGAMRALTEQAAGADAAKLLFGEKLDHEYRKGAIGVLSPYAALMIAPAASDRRRESRRDARRGTFEAVRTAINGAAGVPAANKLFTAEMVAPGARFRLRMRLFGDPRAVPEGRAKAVAALLKALGRDGLALGRGRGDGQGRVRLISLDRVTACWVDALDIQSRNELATWQRRIQEADHWQVAGTPYRFTLRGDVAFLISAGPQQPDPAPTDNDSPSPGTKSRSNIIRALRRAEGVPELPGTSLMGALRARAEWLADLRQLRGTPGHANDAVHIAELFGLRAEQLRDGALLGQLAQRLGVQPIQITGLAGLLRVQIIAPATAEAVTLASVRIDHFAQSPMDGALFSTEAFARPAFAVELRLQPHPGAGCDTELRRWVRRLIRHIALRGAAEEGMMLGHGRNRGFGWFTLSEAE